MATRAPFLGTFLNKVDRKGRVSVPAPFRQVLSKDDYAGIVCFPALHLDVIEGCGLGFMSEVSASLASEHPMFSDEQEELASSFFNSAHQLPWDSGGRVQLPQELIEIAGIDEEAAFVGGGDTFRIWEPAAYRAYQAEKRAKAREKGLVLQLRRNREA